MDFVRGNEPDTFWLLHYLSFQTSLSDGWTIPSLDISKSYVIYIYIYTETCTGEKGDQIKNSAFAKYDTSTGEAQWKLYMYGEFPFFDF